MHFRIPERKPRKRVRFSEALVYILRSSFMPPERRSDEFDAAMHFARLRVFSSQRLLSPFGNRTLPPAPHFALDPVDVTHALLDGVKSGSLSVKDMPWIYRKRWKKEPVITDWADGSVVFQNPLRTFDCVTFWPSLAIKEINALFGAPTTSAPTPEDAKSNDDIKGSAAPIEVAAVELEIDTDTPDMPAPDSLNPERPKRVWSPSPALESERSTASAPPPPEPAFTAAGVTGRRKTGPKPAKREAIARRMLGALRAGRDLNAVNQESLTAEFGEGASRGTVRSALQKALSEFKGPNSDNH